MFQYPIEYPIFDETKNPEHLSLDGMRRVGSNADLELLACLPEYYLQRPWLYFVVDGDYLKCLGIQGKIQCKPEYYMSPDTQKDISVRYPELLAMTAKESRVLFPRFIQVYNALAYQKFTRYYEALMEFKWEAGLIFFPLFEQRNRLCRIDGRLYGWIFNEDKCACSWKLLTDKIVGKEIRVQRGHQFKGKKLKTTLARELLDLHDEQHLFAEDHDTIQVKTPNYMISYKLQLDQADIVKESSNYHPLVRKPRLSSRGYTCLHELTQGKTTVLNDIAELLARLYQPQQPSGYLWVILGEDGNVNSFLRLLANLGAYAAGSAIYEKPSSQRAKRLIIERDNGKNCQMNLQLLRLKSSSDIDLSLFREFIAGKTIDTIEDPYVINNDVQGAGVLLCAATELCEDILRGIPHKVIAIPHEWSPHVEESDYLWMETCLLCHGFHLLCRPVIESAPCALSLDDATGRFVKAFCTSQEGSYTDRGHFYEQFKRYCDTVITMSDKLPGITIFSKYIEKRFSWNSREIRRNKNRRGYENVFLDDDKIEAVIRKAEEQGVAQAIQTTPDDFKAYLDSFLSYLHIPGTLRSP